MTIWIDVLMRLLNILNRKNRKVYGLDNERKKKWL